MPKLIVQTDQPVGEGGRLLLEERILVTNLGSACYAKHLIERLRWAAADAEALEAGAPPAGARTVVSASARERAARRRGRSIRAGSTHTVAAAARPSRL